MEGAKKMQTEEEPDLNFKNKNFTSESKAETARNTGLAFSASISLFGSVVIMIFFGWGVDFFFYIAPWGTVGGIILGALIGFVQFFRITSRILKKPKK
jgi:F0F1-type ATP synthase assembly protein I